MSKIAVIGISCLFPGASSTEAFWEVLKQGRDCRENATDKDFGMDVSKVASEVPRANKIYCLKGGFVRDFQFDSRGFALESDFLMQLDDVFQWPLHVARDALRDAGYWHKGAAASTAATNTGVIMGNYAFPTKLSNQLALPVWHDEMRRHVARHLGRELPDQAGLDAAPHAYNRFVCGLPAAVVAQACGLGGPAYTMDAACSSALYAIKMGSYYLNAGKADIMLAGGVCAPDPWLIHTSFSDLRAYPENGHAQPFSQTSTGIQTGQGAGVVVLKRLDDALADGDRIYCSIEGLGLSNDGAGKHLLSPNPAGQELAYKRAYQEAGIAPSEIDYIECHATGTPLGDQTELNSLEAFFGDAIKQIKLGSVKGMTGHLLTVAGLTSLTKLILSLRQQQLVPTPGVQPEDSRRSQNGLIDGSHLLTAAMPWPAADTPRYAAVSAFGFGGTNAHLVLSDRHAKLEADQKRGEPQVTTAAVNEAEVPTAHLSETAEMAQTAEVEIADVAIVGMGAHFGPYDSLKALEAAQFYGERPFQPATQWRQQQAQPSLVPHSDTLCARVSSVAIEPLAFRIPPAELKHFNQQQLLMLKVADDALLDAGLERAAKAPRNIAVILVLELDLSSHLRRARSEWPWQLEKLLAALNIDKSEVDFEALVADCSDALHSDIESNEVLSYIGNIMASRIASLWNFTGPAFTLSGDGNGVNRGLETAQLMLNEGDVEGALVGAVDLGCTPEEMALNGRLAQQNISLFGEPFDTPLGEGAGAVVLLRDQDAKAQQRRRYARLNAFDRAPESGTQTNIGLVQLIGLMGDDAASRELLRSAKQRAPGAALSNLAEQLGHTRVAAPIAGVISTALALYHRYLPAQSKARKPYKQLLHELFGHQDAPLSPFRPAVSYPWFKGDGGERAALIQSLALSRERDALLLYEADWPDDGELIRREVQLLPLPAQGRRALAEPLDSLLTLDSAAADSAADFAALREQCWQKVKAAPPRHYTDIAVLVASDLATVQREARMLRKHLSGDKATREWKTPAGSYLAAGAYLAARALPAKVAFVYPGGFNSYPYLANGLLRLFPRAFREFERSVGDAGQALSRQWIYPRNLLEPSSRTLMANEQAMLNDIPAMLTNGTSLALLFTRILRDQMAIRPEVAFGYSLGESSMLFANGVWPAEGRSYNQLAGSPLFQDRLSGRRNLVREKWQLADELEDQAVWASFVLMADIADIRAALAPFDRLYITHINSSREAVLAGDPAQFQALFARFKCDAVATPTAHVLHAEIMRDAQSDLASLNSFPSRPPLGEVQLISAGHYQVLETFEQRAIAALNADSLCREVDFPRLMDKAYALGARTFIEVGPGGTCARWLRDHFKQQEVAVLGVTQRGKADAASFAQLLAQLISLQVPLDLSGLLPASAAAAVRHRIDIPFCANARPPLFTSAKNASEGRQTPETLTAAAAPVSVISAVAQTPIANQAPTASQTPIASQADRPAGAAVANPNASSKSAPNSATSSAPAAPLQQRALVYWQLNTALALRSASGRSSLLSGQFAPSARSAEGGTHEINTQRSKQKVNTIKNATAPLSGQASGPRVNLIANNLRNISGAQQAFMDSQQSLQQLLFDRMNAPLVGAGASSSRGPSRAAALAAPQHWDVRPSFPPPHTESAHPAHPAHPAHVKQAQAEPPHSTRPESTRLGQALNLDEPVVMDEAQLLAFAEGRAADAFGPEYAAIDQYPVRVRLPSPPYFFVSRVTQLKAKRGEYEPCMLTTEYDVPEDAWYLVDGVMPPGVAVEAGQSDLLLIAFLGIDFENQGERMYRLLDGKLAFVGDLPRGGQTLRFDIHINAYVRQGGVLLFFFSYEGYVDGKLALRLERGCAGFFSQQQLQQGQGVLKAANQPPANIVKPLYHSARSQLDWSDIVKLSRGELNDVFGRDSHPAPSSGVRLPPEQLLMIDRVSKLNAPQADGYLLIEAFKQLDPEGWYFRSHFVDDPVLPGSLVAEGATQLLKIYLMAIGMQQCFPHGEFQPIAELLMDIKVRGQITPAVETLRYEAQVIESGYLPRPYVIANVLVFDGERPLVAVENLGLCLKEQPGQRVYPRYGEADYFSGRRLADGSDVVLNEFHLAHAAKGDLMTAMGREFGIYGPDHRAPHIPNGDFQFVDRAVMLTGDRGQYQNGSIMVTEYDVPQDAWFYRQNSYPAMPNAVYLESALQASILLGYFLGATLDFPDKELAIRNLDGHATYLSDGDLRGKTIRHRQTLLSTSALNGSVLQNFRFELTVDGEPLYAGESLFGYFPDEALANQLGLDAGQQSRFWYQDNSERDYQRVELAEEADNPVFAAPPERPHYRLAGQQLNLLHRATLCTDGGRYGKGYVFGYREIRETDWYFTCHFHRDPVMPGSLGLEAFVQAIQLYCLQHNIGVHTFRSPRFGIATGVDATWSYRGQLLQSDRDMNIEIHIKEIREEADRIVVIADADLFKNTLRIYHVKQMAVAIREAEEH